MANSQLFILILQWSAITRHIKRPSNILLHENKNTRKAKNRHYHRSRPRWTHGRDRTAPPNRYNPYPFRGKGLRGRTFTYGLYHGNRMDIGGHRFFSKDPDIMKWWTTLLPLQGSPAQDDLLTPCMKTFSRRTGPGERRPYHATAPQDFTYFLSEEVL